MFFLLPACATKKITFSEVRAEGEQAVIYIYRPHSSSNIIVTADVKVDAGELLEIDNNKYTYMFVDAGEHEVILDMPARYTGNHRVQLKVKPAEVVYLKITTALKFEMNKPYSRRFDLMKISKDVAISEIGSTRYLGVEKTVDLKEDEGIDKPEENNPEEKEATFTIMKTRNPFSKEDKKYVR